MSFSAPKLARAITWSIRWPARRPRAGIQVENQVGLVRERFFKPRLRFKSLDELNDWLLDKCVAYAKAHRHPELSGQTIWEVFEVERPKLVSYAGRFRWIPRGAGVLEDLLGAFRQH
jgi:hypothetical protein